MYVSLYGRCLSGRYIFGLLFFLSASLSLVAMVSFVSSAFVSSISSSSTVASALAPLFGRLEVVA